MNISSSHRLLCGAVEESGVCFVTIYNSHELGPRGNVVVKDQLIRSMGRVLYEFLD